ncbi:nuclear transport factor 2 family protein [Brenneria populi subsp. brevivirga]|uniref:nuclear transport factor 2 family protein n=1 Tax=Brenneria populi TaxID=1505588 RepID=UPI002E19E213|nr:nuclear transport factor 2 family protein [Brenneria populi subsp. brevivirga]
MSKEVSVYEKKYTSEECALAEEIIGLEKAALDKFFKGDGSGYAELWSQRSFTYFDARFAERVDDYPTIKNFLDTVIEGRLSAESYDFRSPRVQFGKDMAILTYQLFSNTNLIDMEYNCVEVFQKEEGQWRVVHSTWSLIQPFEKGAARYKDII